MKKIGIITMHYNYNYGALLQSYALQEKLCALGHDAKLIHYINPTDHRRMKLFGEGFIRNIRALFSLKNRSRRIRAFKKFIEENLHLSGAPIYDYTKICESDFDYDVYITGSDQTFNLLLLGDAEIGKAYFLPFIKGKKKISYGASMGEKIKALSDADKAWMQNALGEYAKLSVREEIAADFIEELGVTRPKVVVDPTLLLTEKEWAKIKKTTRYAPGSYILFYSVSSEPWVVQSVCDIAKKMGLKVVAPHFKNRFELAAPFVRADDCGPGEFVSLVKNAAFVCTTSFHGTVFSVLHHKPFISYVLGEGNRIKSILKALQLENRAVYASDTVEIDKLRNIDYTQADALLEEIREESLTFLRENI